jgi:hypothetical protein
VTNQTQRTQANPLVLGTFATTRLRHLRGTLGPKYQVQTNGYGGGTFNHWYQINIADPAWIIVKKGGPRPKYIQVSAYDLNKTPIQGDPIFDADSIRDGLNRAGDVYIPYLDTVMSTGSDLYNTFDRRRLDLGDDRYYPLGTGSYLVCVSSTRNETLDYELGVVVEFPPTEVFIQLEDEDVLSILATETAIDDTRTILISSPVSVDTTISSNVDQPNGFTETSCAINSGVTVTILGGSTWFIGDQIPSDQADEYQVLAEPGDDAYFDTIHDHSLSDWTQAWQDEHGPNTVLPSIFDSLLNRL